MKDYYKILELPPSATAQEVKKAYRRLALAHHPDTNPGNESAGSRFREIQEAYQVLSHPERRSDYNQRRWYRRHAARPAPDEVLTPAVIYCKSVRLRDYIRTVQSSFLNRQALYRYIFNQLLGDQSISVIRAANDDDNNRRIIEALLESCGSLPYDKLRSICGRLQLVAGTDSGAAALIQTMLKRRRINAYWEKYQQVLVLLITLVVCWLIYVVSR